MRIFPAVCIVLIFFTTSIASADFTFGIGGNMRYGAREIIENMGLPLAPVQIELNMGHPISPKFDLGTRIFFRNNKADDPIGSIWAAGPELTYYMRSSPASWRPYLGVGLFWTQNHSKDPLNHSTTTGHSQQWRIGTHVQKNHNSNFFIQLTYQSDRIDSALYTRQNFSLGAGLNFYLSH
ncbi:MAG: hypothetical protein ACI906_004963 [Candidatus Latescibacterota bacterium]|jgi:hypothetical protein